MQNKSLSFFLFLVLLSASLVASQGSIPTLVPQNTLLNSQSNYVMNYFAFKQFQTSSYFQLDFSLADIIVTNGRLNITATLNGTSINQTNITANCTNKICLIRLGMAFPLNTNVEMIFGQLRNPKYTASQRISTLIYFGVNSNQTQTISISSFVYLPMPITVNSVLQSDYGVGTQEVIYTFNLSFTYVPKDPEISIQIPSQIGYSYLETQLNFYGTVQNISPFLTSNMIILSLRVDEINDPKGFMLLTLHGFRNPRFIGTSSSFNITMVQKRIATTSNCVTCRVAYLYANSSKLLTVSSTTSGDIIVYQFNPSSLYVSQRINITIGIKIVAPIPEGGKFRILLPSSITPSLPLSCQAIHGFTISNPSYCIYNQTINAIETVNFSVPYLEQTGDAIIRISVINPRDSRGSQFNFQTLDVQNRKIGRNRQPYVYSSLPLSMNSSVTKSLVELESNFTLASTITLSKSLNKTTDTILVILPPSQFYNLSQIQCISSSLDLGCTKRYENYTNNLLIQFPAPCSVCQTGSNISFRILNVINPSFINDEMKQVQIQTLSDFGVIEASTVSIDLKQKILAISNIDLQGAQQVGSQLKLKIKFQVPRYVQTYGGFLLINYQENSTYLDVAINGSSYNYPQFLNVKNENNQSLQNTLTYFENSRPRSLKQIKIKLCTTDSPCASQLTISTLRKSFYPLKSSMQTFKATTLFGQAISTFSKDMSAFLPQPFSSSLSVVSTISIANSISNYVFKFMMKKIPFDSNLQIDFSSQHKIQANGRCFVEVSPISVLGFGIDCQILNSSSLILSYMGDLTMMMTSSLEYTITVVNVLNPPSVIPINYKIETSVSQAKNGIFSSIYAISSPYTLLLEQITTSNSTYGQQNNMSLKLKAGFYPLDELKVYIPKQNFKGFTSFNGVLSNIVSAGYGLSENSSYFLLDKIYSIANSSLQFILTNVLSTNANGKIFTEMYVQGYLSSRGSFALPAIQPVFLSASVSSSSRSVGQLTNITVDVNRVNPFNLQKSIKVVFNAALFSVEQVNSSYTLQVGSPDTYSYSQLISSWPSNKKSIALSFLRNMKFVPNNQTLSALPKITIQTLDENNSIVARSVLEISEIVPTKFTDSLSYSFSRTSTQSGASTDIVINLVSRYPQKAKLLQIDLPLNENRILSGSNCSTGSAGVSSCIITKQNSTSMTINYVQNQTRVTLKNIMNLFSSDKSLTLTLMTQFGQIIEQSSKLILPVIDYDPMQFTGTSNSSDVSSPVRLDFLLKSIQNDIEVGQKLKITFPDNVYSKILSINSRDCEYEISGLKYSGCQYINDQVNDGKQWLQYVYVNNLGPSLISKGSILTVTLYLTNPWTAYPLNLKAISVIHLNAIGQQISKGNLPLNSMHPTLSSFTASNVGPFTFQETSKVCSADNTLTLSLKVPIILAKQTYVYLTVPSVFYDILPQTGLQILTQSVSYIHVRRLISDCSSTFSNSSGLCIRPNTFLTFSIKTSNERYLSILQQSPKVSFYLFNDNSFVTSNVEVNVDSRVPSQVKGLTLSRTSGNLSQKINSTLKYTFESGFDVNSSFKVSISPSNSSIGFVQSIIVAKQKLFTNSSQTINQIQTVLSGQQVFFSVNSPLSSTVELQIQGMNPGFAPNVQNESYIVKIYDDSYIYHLNRVAMASQSKLKPLSNGIEIKRSSSVVNTLSNYFISGSLPHGVNFGNIIFNQSTIMPAASMINFQNMKIGQFMNPLSSNWDTYESVSILNSTHVLYKNDRLKTNPALQSLTLPANTVKSILYNRDMRINTEETIRIQFTSNQSFIEKIIIKLPTFFKSLKQCTLNSNKLIMPQNIKILTLSDSQKSIEVTLAEPLSKLQCTFLTLQYQKLFTNENIIIETEYPTKSYKQTFNVNVYGTKMLTSLKMTSQKVNEQNYIALRIVPLSKKGIMSVYLPSFLNEQIQNLQKNNEISTVIKLYQNEKQTSLTLQNISGSNVFFFEIILSQTSLASNFSLVLSSVRNPSSNKQFQFLVEQKQSANIANVFGHSSEKVQMTLFEQVFVRSSARSTSKIGLQVEINLKIQVPNTLESTILHDLAQQKCVIQLPDSQVVRNPDGQCEIYLVDKTSETKLPCSLHLTIKNAVVTECMPGINKYSIRKGFKNMLYSVIPTQNQKTFVFIGVPYKMAESKIQQTQFLTPIVTSGSLSLHKISSSTNVRLQKTVINLNTTLENIQEVDFINFRFQKQHFLLNGKQLKCQVNFQQTDCWLMQKESIMLNITQIGTNNLNIQIKGLVNYLKQRNFTIRTLKYLGSAPLAPQQASSNVNNNELSAVSTYISVKSASQSQFGLIDIFYSSLDDVSSSFVSNSYNIRVLNPQNYVSQQNKIIQVIFDDQSKFPSGLNKQYLKFNVTSNIQNCQLLSVDYATSLALNCKFTKSINLQVFVKLFDNSFAEIEISSTQFSSYIYPALTTNCHNQMCDQCSTNQNGIEKCFDCRQNYYEYQNGCMQQCPQGYTQYEQFKTCQKCSATCQSCYGLYPNNCLKCQQSVLVSQDGQCVQSCYSGYPENGFCLGDNECFDKGCRQCSSTGFCYECLPDYKGQPVCTWQQALPSLFMSYFIIPFVIFSLVSSLYFLFAKGVQTFSLQVLFTLSLLQFSVWIFLIPALHTKEQAMLLVSMVILRIVIGIVAYETHYKQQINSHIGVKEEQSLLEKQKSSQKSQSNAIQQSQGSLHFQETWTSKLIRFVAHLNGVDSYQAFKVLFSSQIRIEHNNIYLWITTGNRLLVSFLVLYVLSQSKSGDLTIMPILSLLSSLAIISLRIVRSEKVQQWWSKLRNVGKN